MAAHARLKSEFRDDEKYHNLVRWLIYGTLGAEHKLGGKMCYSLEVFLSPTFQGRRVGGWGGGGRQKGQILNISE